MWTAIYNLYQSTSKVNGNVTQLQSAVASIATALNNISAAVAQNMQISADITANDDTCTIPSTGTYVSPYNATFNGPVTVNTNTAVVPPPPNSAVLQLASADSVPCRMYMQSYGTNSVFLIGKAGGTNAAPTATPGGLAMARIGCVGYDGAAWKSGAALWFSTSASAWSATNNGSYAYIQSIADGSTTSVGVVTFEAGLTNFYSDVALLVKLFYPGQFTTVGAPAYVKGAVYFDSTLNKLRIGGATNWETVTSI
jgi:hypothetical protein